MHLHQGTVDDANMMVFFGGKTPLERIEQLVLPDSGWVTLNRYPSLWYRMDSPDLIFKLKTPLSQFNGYTCIRFALQFVFRHSIQRGGLPFHAALVEHQGKGVLLAGTSGTGKSTCCRRLSPPWQARCDDEVLLTLAPDGRYLAHPFPTWSDYVLQRGANTYNSQDPSPLAGIFFLEQSSTDACLPLSTSEAVVEAIVSAQVVLARFLWCCGPEEARSIRAAMFTNAIELLQKVPTFRLRVSLTGRFWERIEGALDKL
jgi:SynChlorMet cassette protein ScmC